MIIFLFGGFLVQDQERAYFDSADWVLGKVSNPSHPSRNK